jgi:hypothetical protein
LFGLKVKDHVKPVFKTLAVYPVDGMVEGSGRPAYFPLINKNGVWRLEKPDPVVLYGQVGFGIECYDKENNSSGNNQVYSLELQVDGQRIYYFQMDRFAFDQTLYVNGHIDYKAQRTSRKSIQRAYLLRGNKFPAYKDIYNNGLLNFYSDSVHTATFIAKDFSGNSSEFSFKIKITKKQVIKSEVDIRTEDLTKEVSDGNPCYAVIAMAHDPDSAFNFTDTNRYKAVIPPGSFYEQPLMVKCMDRNPDGSLYERKEKWPGTYSLLFRFPGKYVPIHNRYSLSLKVDTLLPDSLNRKLLIGMRDEKGKFSSKGGEYRDGWVTTQTRSFGIFAVIMDSTAPFIKEPRLPKGNSITHLKVMEFKINDNLSGIKHYRVTLDGKWVLFEYEPKNKSLFCKTADLPDGKHTLKVVVTDEKDNQRVEWLTYTK